MTTGAAHGAGIYLSTSATMSMGYARMGHYAGGFAGGGMGSHLGFGGAGGGAAPGAAVSAAAAGTGAAAGGGGGGNAFLAGSDLKMLALCEVAQVPTLRKTSGQHGIWVAPDENAVVTRFLFAFPHGARGDGVQGLPNDSTAQYFEDEVRACIKQLEVDARP